MSIASQITRINTNIANSYTAVDGKGGTLPATQNSANLATAINSIEVIEQATAEGESLNLANTKAMPYSDYAVEGKSEQDGEPSPSNPSEIHSVADDVNLLNEKTLTHGQLLSNNVINSSQTRMGYSDFINVSDFTNITIKLNSSTIYRLEKVFYYDASKNEISYELSSSNPKTVTLPSNTVYVRISITTTNWSSSVTFDEVKDDLHIKLQKGTVATPYSPYNQGTVTIKQRGKNLWTSNLPILFSDRSSIVQDNNNGGIDMTIASSASLGYIFYDLGLISDFAGKTLTFSISNEPNVLYKWCAFVTCNADGSNRQELKNFYGNNQITYTVGNNYSQTHLAIRLYISDGTPNTTYSINNVQVEENSEKTSYEPYQSNDYTFQTEPLRSLPNGVKDTIEADGIHRRVGRVVLDGTENWDNYTAVSGNIVQCRLMLSSNCKSRVGLSDRFLVIADYSATEHIVIGGALNNAVFIHINKSRLSTEDITGFKNWLSNNNIELLYELATEIIEPLTQNQATTMLDIIKTGSYEGTTNIYTDEDVKPTIGVGYYKKA